jgi:hypothetical protein
MLRGLTDLHDSAELATEAFDVVAAEDEVRVVLDAHGEGV